MNLQDYLKHNQKSYLIFDLDRTLAELQIDWSTYRRKLWDTVATFDEPLTKEVPFAPWKGIELTNKAVKKHGKNIKTQLDSFNEAYELSHYSGYRSNPLLLDFIKKNTTYTLFLWTNNQRKTIEPFLVSEGILASFKKIITRDTVQFIKPDPEGFSHIYIYGTPKEQYLMIGDSFNDQYAAKDAGIDFFLVDFFNS